MRCPAWLYRWIDRRGRIPRWVRVLWPWAHWCPGLDGLLIVDNAEDCCCTAGRSARWWLAIGDHKHDLVRP